ncbi:hypothetical protein PHYSODRAFT_507615, partial [Phytophthora sojae]
SDFFIIETSSTIIMSKSSKSTEDKPLSKTRRKLASVLPPIIVVAYPVSAVFIILVRRPQLQHRASTASITRLFPVPPSPPRNIRSC